MSRDTVLAPLVFFYSLFPASLSTNRHYTIHGGDDDATTFVVGYLALCRALGDVYTFCAPLPPPLARARARVGTFRSDTCEQLLRHRRDAEKRRNEQKRGHTIDVTFVVTPLRVYFLRACAARLASEFAQSKIDEIRSSRSNGRYRLDHTHMRARARARAAVGLSSFSSCPSLPSSSCCLPRYVVSLRGTGDPFAKTLARKQHRYLGRASESRHLPTNATSWPGEGAVTPFESVTFLLA